MADQPSASVDELAGSERSAARFFRAAAVAALVVAVGALGWSFWRAGKAQAPTRPAHLPPPRAAAPSFEQPAQPAPGFGADQAPNILAEVEEGALNLYDDQGVYAQIDYKTLTPRPAGRIDLEAPSAWLFLDNGRAARLQANRGQLTQPPGADRPESGLFEGQVRIELFTLHNAKAGRAPRDDQSLPPADLVVRTERVRFDLALGEIEAPGRIDVAGPGVRGRLSNLSVRINEQDRSLALLLSDGPGVFGYNFEQARAHGVAQRQKQAALPASPDRPRPEDATAGASAENDAAPLERFYHALVEEAVGLRLQGRAAAADRLELWARLVDNRLADDAVFTLPRRPGRDGASTAPGRRRPAATAEEAAQDFGEAFDADALVRWTGLLRIEPAMQRPRQLRDDEAFLTLSAPSTGKTTLRDDEAGVLATCNTLEAALTRGVVALIGAGDVGVTIEREGAGTAIAGRFEIDLARGVGTFPGAGAIRAGLVEPSPDLPPMRRELSWRGGADLLFATRDGAIDLDAKAPLREAIFRDGVEARESDTLLTGGSLRALFSPATGLLARLIVEDQALLDADERGRLAADRLDVRFEPAKGAEAPEGLAAANVEPVVATAEGAVRAQRQGAALRADLAEATFSRGQTGELVVSMLNAAGDVRVRTPEGATAEAQSLRADLLAETAQLSGEPAAVSLEGARVEGASISLAGPTGAMTVFGPGALFWTPSRAQRDLGYDRVEARFAEVFEFNRDALTARFAGKVRAQGLGAGAQDTLTCHWLDIQLRRTDGSQEEGLEGLTVARAVAQGESDTAPATIERRERGQAASGDVQLRQLVYLEGRIIEADNQARTLTVPTPGRLLVERRETSATAKPQRQDALEQLAGSQGTTLFEWRGQLLLDDAAGVASMTRQVRLRHLPRGAQQAAMIECERLEATFDDQEGAGLLLRSAQASGAVYAAMGLRELIADALLYDADKAALAARANPPNAIILFDRAQPAPLTGSALLWRLDLDRVEWRDAGTLSAPGALSAQPAERRQTPEDE